MKRVVLVAVLPAVVVGLFVVDGELAVSAAFGWLAFLARVVPRLRPDAATLIAAAVAVVLFTAGVHALGRSWRRSAGRPGWTVRCSVAVSALAFVLFAAATAMIGVAHQVGWLVSSPDPYWVTTLKHSSHDSARGLRILGLSAANYTSTFGDALPPGGTFTPDGRPLHSWETHLLPYIAYDVRGIDMTLPWDHPKHADKFRTILPDFINNGLRGAPLADGDGFGLSHYAGNSHVLMANQSLKLDEITDGTSATLLFGEVNAAFGPWGKPLNVRDPAAGINRSPRGFGGPRHAGGASFAMADGSVRFVSEKVSQDVLQALATPRGGEEVDPDALPAR